MTRTSYIAAMILASSAAHANPTYIATSSVTLQETDAPGAIAEVIFHNLPSNGPHHDGNYEVTLDGLTVQFRFEWDAMGGDDALHLSVPEGLVIVPPFLAVPEGGIGRALIYAGGVGT